MGGASILSGVGPFGKLRTTASPVELQRRTAWQVDTTSFTLRGHDIVYTSCFKDCGKGSI